MIQKRYQCDQCESRFYYYWSLIHHMESNDSCEKSLKSTASAEAQPRSEKTQMSCQLCEFSHVSAQGIIDHLIQFHVGVTNVKEAKKKSNMTKAKTLHKIPLIRLQRL